MSRVKSRHVAGIFVASILLACGGGGDSVGGGGGGGGVLDESQRFATIRAGQAEYVAHAADTKATRDAALVSFFKSQTTVEDAGVSSSNNVWVRFKDGVLHHIFDNKVGPRPGAPSGPRQLARDMPANPTAYTDFSLDPGWTDISDVVGQWLQTAGYTVSSALRVSDFEAMNNVGVLFWQTHSGEGDLKGGGKDFCFMTSTVASETLGQGIYKSLRDNGYLSTGDVVLQQTPFRFETRYAITNKYIREKLRGKFARNSLVAIDSCGGANPGSAAAWSTAGAACYVGWDNLSGNRSEIALKRLFDRLCAENKAEPFSVPEERPFDMNSIVQWMQTSGFDDDTSPNSAAKLKFYFNAVNGDFQIIRPTILRILNEANSQAEPYLKWLIEGTFGADPGAANRQVVFGTTVLPIVRWEDYGIVVRVPTANMPSGEVQVVIGTRKSQPVPQTVWNVPFTYKLIGEGSLQYTVVLNLKIRADIRGQRFMPQDLPTFGPVVVWTQCDTSGTSNASGELRDNQGKLVERWSGSRTLKPYVPPFPTTNYVHFQGNFDKASSTLKNFTAVSTGTYDTKAGADTGMAALRGIPINMSLTVDWQTLRINGNTITANPSQLGSHGVSATLQWPSVLPTNAPVDQDQRKPRQAGG